MENVHKALLVSEPTVPPIPLLRLLTEHLGTSWITDDFDSVIQDVREGLGQPHPIIQEKIRALRACAATAAPWTRYEVFAPVVQAMNGIVPDFSRHMVMEAHELALAIKTMGLVRSGEDFSDEVRKYIASSLMSEGLFFSPITELNMCRAYLRPHNLSAFELFRSIMVVPLEDVEVPDNNDGYQAALGKAQLEVFLGESKDWFKGAA